MIAATDVVEESAGEGGCWLGMDMELLLSGGMVRSGKR